MRALGRSGVLAVLACTVTCASGCARIGLGTGDYTWFGGQERLEAGSGPMRVRWARPLTRELESTSYVPVELAVPILDAEHDRVYVGSTNGALWAFNAGGGPIYRVDARGGVESAPALDAAHDQLYVATTEGVLHALRASNGQPRWRRDVGGAVRNAPVLTADTVYVVTTNDVLTALSRTAGETLWTYRRDPLEGFAVTGHAGLTLVGGKLLAAFTDGVVVALDAGDGHVLWERDTGLDLEEAAQGSPRFLDVDTTPIVVGHVVYVASFSAGLYAIDLEAGGTNWRKPEVVGVVASALAGDRLLLSSAEAGLTCMSLGDEQVQWRRPALRGAPAMPVVVNGLVLVGESEGGFLALELATGHEVGRIEAGAGFSAAAAVSGSLGFVLSNGGSLMAFRLGA